MSRSSGEQLAPTHTTRTTRTTEATRATRATRAARAALRLALFPALAGCTTVSGAGDEFGGASPARAVSPQEAAARGIRERDIRRDVAFLADDDRRGRDTPGRELDRAAARIANSFREAGLEPAGEDGGYIQFWPYEAAGALAPNVVGVLPGSEVARSGEYVVVVAHFDHLGIGPPVDGDSIYNGADDNASGTAALLAIARAFAALDSPPARPVLFLATSGEEKGLLGARSFVDQPTVFLTGAVAVLNMDMVGRNHPDSVAVIGHRFSTLGPLIDRIAADAGLVVRADPLPEEGLFTRGDHYPFAQQGIPAVGFTTLFHEDHHRPSDEAGLVDVGKIARVARLVFLVAHELASGLETPEWTEAGRRAVPQPDAPGG